MDKYPRYTIKQCTYTRYKLSLLNPFRSLLNPVRSEVYK